MGMFKQFKQMAGVVNEMPAVLDQARALQEQALAAQMNAQAYAGIPQPAAPAADDPRTAPIEGVALSDYARISKVAASRGLDRAGLDQYLLSQGLDPEVYQRATAGWNDRFRGDMALATLYGRLYHEAQV